MMNIIGGVLPPDTKSQSHDIKSLSISWVLDSCRIDVYTPNNITTLKSPFTHDFKIGENLSNMEDDEHDLIFMKNTITFDTPPASTKYSYSEKPKENTNDGRSFSKKFNKGDSNGWSTSRGGGYRGKRR